MHEPRLLLLDEPTVGLDVEARHDIVTHVRRLVKDDGLSVLWATHLMDEICGEDSVVILHEGTVLASGMCTKVIRRHKARDLEAVFSTLAGLMPEKAA